MSHILVITFLRSFSVASVGQSRGIMDRSAIYTPAFLHNLYLLWLLLSKAPPPYIHIYIFLSSSNIYAIKCTHFNCTVQWLSIFIYSCNYHPVRDILQKMYTQWFVLIHTHTHTHRKDHARTRLRRQPSTSQERDLKRNKSDCWHLDTGLLASRTLRLYFCCLSHPTCGALLWQL